MSHVIDDSAFDRATEPLFRLLTNEQLAQLTSLVRDQRLESRVAELASKAQHDELSQKERAEYEGYVRANNLIAVVQGIARRSLTAERS